MGVENTDGPAIESVAVAPDHCHRRGTAVETNEFDGGDVAFRPVEDVLSMTDRSRTSDRKRIEKALEAAH